MLVIFFIPTTVSLKKNDRIIMCVFALLDIVIKQI